VGPPSIPWASWPALSGRRLWWGCFSWFASRSPRATTRRPEGTYHVQQQRAEETTHPVCNHAIDAIHLLPCVLKITVVRPGLAHAAAGMSEYLRVLLQSRRRRSRHCVRGDSSVTTVDCNLITITISGSSIFIITITSFIIATSSVLLFLVFRLGAVVPNCPQLGPLLREALGSSHGRWALWIASGRFGFCESLEARAEACVVALRPLGPQRPGVVAIGDSARGFRQVQRASLAAPRTGPAPYIQPDDRLA
jgi:hypothetical protein